MGPARTEKNALSCCSKDAGSQVGHPEEEVASDSLGRLDIQPYLVASGSCTDPLELWKRSALEITVLCRLFSTIV
jgi:hypothetical protein